MTEYNNDYQELEDLRQQVTLLREKLSNQELVTRRALLESIRLGVRKINNGSIVLPIIALLGAAFSYWAFRYFLSFSLEFSIFTVIFLVVAAVAHVLMHRRVMAVDVSQGNLVEVAKSVERLRRGYTMWPLFGVPFLIVWLMWLFLQEVTIIPDGPMKDGFMCGSLVGAVAGALISLRLRRRTMNMTRDIIKQIRELQEDKD